MGETVDAADFHQEVVIVVEHEEVSLEAVVEVSFHIFSLLFSGFFYGFFCD